MKPKNLKAAFSWEERRPLLADGVFHVPNYYDKYASFSLPAWDDAQLFGNTYPISIEYCSGNGGWIVEKAQHYPEVNWIAVEMRYDRVRKIWSKRKNHALSNLLVVCAEARIFTHHYLQNQSIEEVFINFPDPWPKEKHEKHRLMQLPFLDELARVLKSNKRVTFVSDDPTYTEHASKLFSAHPHFSVSNPLEELPGYGSSWFEELWRKKGKTIQYLQFFTKTWN